MAKKIQEPLMRVKYIGKKGFAIDNVSGHTPVLTWDGPGTVRDDVPESVAEKLIAHDTEWELYDEEAEEKAKHEALVAAQEAAELAAKEAQAAADEAEAALKQADDDLAAYNAAVLAGDAGAIEVAKIKSAQTRQLANMAADKASQKKKAATNGTVVARKEK